MAPDSATLMHATARLLLAAGLAVVPAHERKHPALASWKTYQDQLPLADEVDEWFAANPYGLGIVCGRVSGGLEVADLDAKHDATGTLNDRAHSAIEEFAPGLWDRLPRERTPSGGLHLYFRSDAPAGNLKLARVPDAAGKLNVVAETRGEGGFIVVAPTPGYVLENGDLAQIPHLTADERDALLAALRSLDESPAKEAHQQARVHGVELSPIDDFNDRGDAVELLRRHGWHVGPERADGSRMLRRPGKNAGWSATWNHAGRGKLCVFSSSTPFDTAPTTYGPAGVFGVLECGGDFHRAAAELRRQGFGSQRGPEANTPTASQPAPEESRSVPLASLSAPDDALVTKSNLLGNGFIRRGQTGLLNGPTGVGKSSLTMQSGICWAVDRPFLGIRPQRALRILICQSENDDSDIAEMRDGVLRGLRLTPSELTAFRENVRIVRSFKSGIAWLAEMEPDVIAHRPDLVIVDPLFAYAGVDLAKDQPGLSAFLRGALLPFTIKHDLGILLIHHVNKPPTSTRDKGAWQGGDFAYSGSGHNELANFVRFVIVLRSLGSTSVFEFRIGKRWKRAGMADRDGNPTDRCLIKHAARGIFWETATETELAESIQHESSPVRQPRLVDEAKTLASAFFTLQKDGRTSLERLAKKLKQSEKTLRRRFGDRRMLRIGDDLLCLSEGIIMLVSEADSADAA